MDDAAMDEFEERLGKSISTLKKDLSKLRTGVASISLLEDIKVSYYGQPTPLNQVATVSAPDGRTLRSEVDNRVARPVSPIPDAARTG